VNEGTVGVCFYVEGKHLRGKVIRYFIVLDFFLSSKLSIVHSIIRETFGTFLHPRPPNKLHSKIKCLFLKDL